MVKTSGKSASARGNSTKAMSLHIGLNAVDPKHYAGWSGPLAACEFDANDMAAIAAAKKMTVKVLLTKSATRKEVLAAMRAAATRLGADDLYFLTYSGHGGQITDTTGDEPDKKDETWCLYDSQLIDDELYFELGKFAPRVRILVLSDSCHSGTVTRQRVPEPPPGMRSKLMPVEVAQRVYEKHQAFYDKLQAELAQAAGKSSLTDPDAVLSTLAVQSGRIGAIVKTFKPAAILISGCQDNQTSMDGDHNGAFTGRLRQVWNNGAFANDYARFHSTIRAGMPPSQSPNLFLLGDAAAFVAQKPFTV